MKGLLDSPHCLPEYRERYAILKSVADVVGVTIRNDSRLAYAWVKGTTTKDETVHDVIYELCTMRWLYEYTDYPQLLQAHCKNEEKRLRLEGHSPEVHREQMQRRRPLLSWFARNAAISNHGGVPSIWPWLWKQVPMVSSPHTQT